MQAKPEELLTPTQAAEILGVTIQRISALCLSNLLTYRKIGRYKFPFRESVLHYKTDENRLKYAPKHGEKMPGYLKGKGKPEVLQGGWHKG